MAQLAGAVRRLPLWQQEELGEEEEEGSEMARQLKYWKKRLAGLPEEMNVARDYGRAAVSSQLGESIRLRIDGELHEGLLRVGREGRASLFMVLQTGLAAVLKRWGAGEDIVVGSPIAGRTDDALENLVGFFVNTLVLRTDVSGEPRFMELLERVRESDLGAYAHQDIPFERLVEVLNPERSLARHPLFQVMLVLQNTGVARWELPGLKVKEEEVGTHTAKFDLTFSLMVEKGEERRGKRDRGEHRVCKCAV